MRHEWTINLLKIKIFALLMCPGNPIEKAPYLFDLIAGTSNDVNGNEGD